MNAEERLIEWGRELFYPGWDIPCATGGALGRMADLGNDHRVRGRKSLFARALARIQRRKASLRAVPCKETVGIRMEIVTVDGESTACKPDGGMTTMYGLMIDRMAKSLALRDRCKEISELLAMMPADSRAVVRVTYQEVAGPNEVGREGVEAAAMLKISERTYWRRKAEMLEWLSVELGLRQAHAA